MLTQHHTATYCLPFGGHLQCRYLAEEDGRYYCLKKTTKKDIIDVEVEEQKKAHDRTMPLGNNCDGYPLLKHIWQGKDS
jgi:hypothetical protein